MEYTIMITLPIKLRKRLSLIFIMCLMSFSFILLGDESLWITDFDQGLKIAAEKQLPVLLSFTGSDWCVYCKKLEEEVFSKSEFKDFVKDKFVLIKIDFPRKNPLPADVMKKHHQLAQKYKIKEFPAVIFLTKDEVFILKSGYREGGTVSYINFLKIVKKLDASVCACCSPE